MNNDEKILKRVFIVLCIFGFILTLLFSIIFLPLLINTVKQNELYRNATLFEYADDFKSVKIDGMKTKYDSYFTNNTTEELLAREKYLSSGSEYWEVCVVKFKDEEKNVAYLTAYEFKNESNAYFYYLNATGHTPLSSEEGNYGAMLGKYTYVKDGFEKTEYYYIVIYGDKAYRIVSYDENMRDAIVEGISKQS